MGDEDDSQSEFIEEYKSENSKKGFVIIFGIFFLILIGGLAWYLVISPESISSKEISEETLIDLSVENQVKIEVDEQEYNILVENISDDFVEIIIQEKNIRSNLKIGEIKKFDLNENKTYDLQIEFKKTEEDKLVLFIKKINEIICVEDWSCSDWSNCTNESQTKICSDLNNCGTIVEKPKEEQGCSVDEEENLTIPPFETNNTLDFFLNLGISFSKSSYKVGENINGNYFMEYGGISFKGIVLYTFSRKDCSYEKYAKAYGTVQNGSFEKGGLGVFKNDFKAFKYAKSGKACSYIPQTDFFDQEGIYKYGISVYNCTLIEAKINATCSNALDTEIALLTPMREVSKEIIIVMENSTS